MPREGALKSTPRTRAGTAPPLWVLAAQGASGGVSARLPWGWERLLESPEARSGSLLNPKGWATEGSAVQGHLPGKDLRLGQPPLPLHHLSPLLFSSPGL